MANVIDKVISGFFGEYRFLSNFYPCTIISFSSYNPFSVPYKSVEHYYQAFKATTVKDHMAVVASSSPYKAKEIGRRIKIRDDWDENKDQIMKYALESKFRDEHLRKMLISTHNNLLIEMNTWGDTYWGVDKKTGIGLNKLGNMLMELRNEIMDSFVITRNNI